MTGASRSLADVAPQLEAILTDRAQATMTFRADEITRATVQVRMRDGIWLATELFLPPSQPAPALALRTPYGRAAHAEPLIALARCGYVVVSQDVRGTGDSEPDTWDFSLYELDDSIDFVDWVAGQPWYDGFLGGLGGSYVGATQWCMAMHSQMTAIAPEVGDLGRQRFNGIRPHMFVNAYSQSVGHGADKLDLDHFEMERRMQEATAQGGYFNDPLDRDFGPALIDRYPLLATLPRDQAREWLWRQYCALSAAQRAELTG